MTQKGNRRIRACEIDYSGKCCLYFDGGSKRGLASGGYLIFDKHDKLNAGSALFYGKGTNNEAEAWSCLALLLRLQTIATPAHNCVLHGDSRLVIEFLTWAAKPGKQSLFRAISQYKRIPKTLPCTVDLVYIPRD